MTDDEVTNGVQTITKNSKIGLGAFITGMVMVCSVAVWIGVNAMSMNSRMVTMSVRMEALPQMQKDLRRLADATTKNNGTLLQLHAELERTKERVKALEDKPIPPPWFKEIVDNLKTMVVGLKELVTRELDEIKRRLVKLEK